MKVRNYIHDPAELSEQVKELIKSNKDYELGMKLTLISMVLEGALPRDVAEHTKYNARTIQLWVKAFDEEGVDGLAGKPHTGRKPFLSDIEKEDLREVLSDPDSAKEYGYETWSGKSLSSYIMEWYGVELKERACQRLLHELGFSYIVPQTFPAHPENTEKRDSFKNKLTELLKDPSNVIVSQDEVHFQLQTQVTKMWCPKGSSPIVGSAPGKETIPYSGFVILGKGNGHFFYTKPEGGKFNYITTIASIRAFIAAFPMPTGCKVWLIMDNAPWHKKTKRLVRENQNGEYNDILEAIDFLDIPPYSPDPNPIEQVLRIVRREVTHNQYFPRLSMLEETLDAYFAKLAGSNEKLAKPCTFQFDKKKPGHKQKTVLTVGTYYSMDICSRKKQKTCTSLTVFGQYNLFPTANLQ